MDTASLFTTQRLNFEGFEIQPVMERFWSVLSLYRPLPLTTCDGKDITDLQQIKRPMMQGCIMSLKLDKLEKMVIGYWSIARRLSVVFIIAYPEDGYDFPVLGSDIMEKKEMATLILDVHPVVDLVLYPANRERYLDGMEPVWKKYLDLNNDHNPNAWYRAMQGPYAVSSRVKMTVENRAPAARQLECLAEYLDYYLAKVVASARPAEGEAAARAHLKKQAIKDLYRAKDPGLGPMMVALGPFATRRVGRVIY
jgi:hypothetical protein